jgi:RNA-directed DNA polymerase
MIKPTITLQELQARIGSRAKSAPTHRFWGMYVHMTRLETLAASYHIAKGNRGAAGIDKVTFEQVELEGRDQFLWKIAAELKAGTYRALPYRKVDIPKGNGKTRTIAIAAIRDRVVQGAMKLLLEPIFEADFSNSSYGARPGRRAHEALGRVREALRQRKHRVVDLDLAAFFDTITHRVLLARLARRIQDPKVLALLKWFLKGAGKVGIPQGSPLSPLLANVLLTDLDNALDRGRELITYVRYLDDMVVLAPESSKGRLWSDRALARIEYEVNAAGVQVNQEKTKVMSMGDAHASFSFLGFDFRWKRGLRRKGMFAMMTPRPKKVIEVQQRIRAVLRSHRHLAVEEVVRDVNSVLLGWANYFRAGHSSTAMQKVKRYAELRIRRFAARQRKRRGFGWKRWSNETIYGRWGLYANYRTDWNLLKAAPASQGNITPN